VSGIPLAALPIRTYEATRGFARPANRVCSEACAPSAYWASPASADVATAGTTPSLGAGPAGLLLCLTPGDPAGSLATLSRGLKAYHARLAGRARYFGPVTPLDLRV
jgi:hypothetical protein